MTRAVARGRADALAAFHEISSGIVASLDLDETLLAIARAATEVLDTDIGAIFLPAADRSLVSRGIYGARSPLWEGLRLNSERGLNAQARRSGRTVRVDDYLPIAEADPELLSRALILDEPIHSAMAVPVRRRGESFGTIGVYRRQVRPFDDEDEFLLDLLSQQAGLAIDNALTYSELEAARDNLQVVIRRLETAIEVAADLSQSLDPSEVIRRVLVRAIEAGRADRGVLLRIDGDSTVVEDFHDVTGAADIVGYRHPIGRQPLMREAVRSRRPVLGGRYDVTKIENPLSESLQDVRHTATIPLVLDGEVTAVMVLSRRREEPFIPGDLMLFQLMGNQAVLALRNARLFAQAQALFRAQSDFLNMAAHELRTPISVISGYVSMMEDGTLGEPPRDWRAPLRKLRSKSAELETLISELLVASRLEAGTLPPLAGELDLGEAAAGAVARARIRAELVGGQVRQRGPAEPVAVSGDPAQVARILDNLLNNALSYSAGPPRVTVTVRGGEQPSVEVRDNGGGIPPAEREKIFDRFYRVDDPGLASVPGTGLGLYISRQMAQRMGGSLTLERSAVGRGSTFVLRLPRGQWPAVSTGP